MARIPNLKSIRPDIPSDLEQIVYRALAAEPSDRFASADEMRKALGQYLNRMGLVSGKQLLISFMSEFEQGNDQDHTKALGAEQMALLNAGVGSNFFNNQASSSDFEDQEKTPTVDAHLFHN